VRKVKRVAWYDSPWAKIVALLSAILGIVGFVTTKSADGVEADGADTKARLEAPLESRLESAQSPNEGSAEVPAEPRPAAPSTVFATGEWTVRLGVHGKDGSMMKCTIGDGGRFACPDACGPGKPSSGTLKLDEAGKKLTETYAQSCDGKPYQLLYDVEHVDRASIALKRERDWQNWSLVE
jgi:hypothetical protein